MAHPLGHLNLLAILSSLLLLTLAAAYACLLCIGKKTIRPAAGKTQATACPLPFPAEQRTPAYKGNENPSALPHQPEHVFRPHPGGTHFLKAQAPVPLGKPLAGSILHQPVMIPLRNRKPQQGLERPVDARHRE